MLGSSSAGTSLTGAAATSGIGAGVLGAGPSSLGNNSTGLYGTAASASETDGETFDGDADFDEDEEWDYNEILSNLSKNVKTYVFQPLVVGAAAAFGMSIGYAMFDATASLLVRKPRAR